MINEEFAEEYHDAIFIAKSMIVTAGNGLLSLISEIKK